MTRPKVVAIVPSAGSGKRLGMRRRKPFVLLGGQPIILRTLKAIGASHAVDSIIVAAEKSCIKSLERLVRASGIHKNVLIVAGGKTRSESVWNCLKAADPSYDIVLIHDGARPFVERRVIEEAVRLARRYGAAIAAVQEYDTVKLVDGSGFINKTLDRTRIFRAQTPQAFRRGLIMKAYARAMARKVPATDDASFVEALGARVRISPGSYRNIKITTRADIKFAKGII